MTTLIVHTQGTLVEARAGHLRLVTPDGLRSEVPLIGIDRLHAYGKVQITTQALVLLAEGSREVVWFSRGGRMRARLAVNPAGGGIAVRRAQYRAADDPAYGLALSQRLVAAKLHNQRSVLLRAWRARSDLADAGLLERLVGWGDALDEAITLDQVRGLEGTGAALYFPAWAKATGVIFPWNGRNRRPPRDPLNLFLSFGYTLLANEVQAQLEAIGLDPWLGFLHAERPGHAALASDLMEPMRPVLVDRMILDLVGHRRLGWQHLESQPPRPQRDPDRLDDADPPGETDGGQTPIPRLTDEGRKVFLSAWERRMMHEDAEDGAIIGGRKILSDQVDAFARSLRTATPDMYVPFRLRT